MFYKEIIATIVRSNLKVKIVEVNIGRERMAEWYDENQRRNKINAEIIYESVQLNKI